MLPTNASILVILMGSLGDVTRGLSIVEPLKRLSPQCRISWLVEPACLDLVKLCPQVDQVIVFERDLGLRGAWRLVKRLRKEEFHLVIDLQRIFKSGLFSRLSRARRRLGFNRRNAKELNWIFNNEHIAHYPPHIPKHEHYWKFLDYLGSKSPAGPLLNLGVPEVATSCPQWSRLINHDSIALILGSSWPSKNWPLDGYRQLLRLLPANKGQSIVLLGLPRNLPAARQLAAEFGGRPIVNAVGDTSLVQLCSILKQVRAVIGPDSGPAHLASALGTPYISLFGPTDPGRTAPCGGADLVLRSAIGCSPCYLRVCPGIGRLCLRLISAEAVLEKLDLVLARPKESTPPPAGACHEI